MEIRYFPYVRICGLAVLVCLFCSCAARSRPRVETLKTTEPTRSSSREVEALPLGVFHRVMPGQTLWRIAKTYDVRLETLIQANSIDDAARIAVGEMIWVPGARSKLDVAVVAPLRIPAAAAGQWTWPVPNGTVLSGFGAPRRNHRHGGIDIGAASGHAVLATRAGEVVYRGDGMRGYGNTIIVDHGNGLQSLYAHNSALLVRLGEAVRQGQLIARVGHSGNATTDHLHFEIRLNDQRVDPARWVQRSGVARR